MSDDDHKTPAWLWIIGFLLMLAALGAMDSRPGTEGNGNNDDGCSSGVSTQGCFP